MAVSRSAVPVDLVVERRGNARLRPQSPWNRDEADASMACRMGYGRVAVSDRLKPFPLENSRFGRGRGGGMEKTREDRSNCAVGERCLDMTGILQLLLQRSQLIEAGMRRSGDANKKCRAVLEKECKYLDA